MLVGDGLFERCSMYLLVCIVYKLPLVVELYLVVFALFNSFTLIFFVFVAFYFVVLLMLNNIRLFPFL